MVGRWEMWVWEVGVVVRLCWVRSERFLCCLLLVAMKALKRDAYVVCWAEEMVH